MTGNSFIKKHAMLMICLILSIATFSVYWQIRQFDFISYDDTDYVTHNLEVQRGITPNSIIWAFTTMHASNWHPVTWLSHMLDCQLFGLNPGDHHLTNLFFHILNTLLLFFIFRKMTGKLWQSAFVAALFGLHPLHVESVAWISERKDVLSTCFFLLTLWSYFKYTRKPSILRYLPVVILFSLGLMSKPMLVTLPFVLLLLDFWPLCRFRLYKSTETNDSGHLFTFSRLLWEKTPLFILSAASCVITFYAQKIGGAVKPFEVVPFSSRIANVLISYLMYLVKMIYPVNLAFLYPYPANIQWWHVAGAGIVLGVITLVAFKTIKTHPYVFTGWFWYLGTLIPVIGIVQVGSQAMADRYTYIPLIGIFMAITWGTSELTRKWRYQKIGLSSLSIFILLILAGLTWKQTGYWKNSITLFRHAVDVTPDNFIAHYNLGNELARQGKTDGAIENYIQTLKINPNFGDADLNLGNVYFMQGRLNDAIKEYQAVLRLNPDVAGVYYNLGVIFDKQKKIDDAIANYKRAIRLKDDYETAYFNLGVDLFEKRDFDGAMANFKDVLRINPDNKAARNNLDKILYIKKNIQ